VIAQDEQRVLDERVIDEMDGHDKTIHDRSARPAKEGKIGG
jgi:hypothetical protein